MVGVVLEPVVQRPQELGQATRLTLGGPSQCKPLILGTANRKGWRTVMETSGHWRLSNMGVFNMRPLFRWPPPAEFQRGNPPTCPYTVCAFYLSCFQTEFQVVINIKAHESQKRMKGGSETIKDRIDWIRNLGQESCNNTHSLWHHPPAAQGKSVSKKACRSHERKCTHLMEKAHFFSWNRIGRNVLGSIV